MFEWLQRRFGRPAAAPIVPTEEQAAARESATAHARQLVRAGYDTPAEIPQIVADGHVDELPEAEARALATAAIDDELRRLRAEQGGWPAVTDYDRLVAAFDAMGEAGIVARENFACCGTCGHAEIGDEFEAVEARGVTVRGYAFFHMQDTAAAVDGSGLYLAYGGVDGTWENDIVIAGEIVAILQRSGLAPDWNGRADTRIRVPMRWQRRV